MKNMFTRTLDTVKEALKGFSGKASVMVDRVSVLRDLHWGEEEALRRLLPLCTEAGDLCMTARVLQDAIASCKTLAGLEALASRVHDLRARGGFLEDSLLQEEEEARGRLQAITARLR